MDDFIKLETSLVSEVDGKRWNLYGVEYENSDGKYSFYLYAISFEHAELLLQDIKDTAKVYGQLGGFVQCGDVKP